ncbi:DEAD/DEAH box helicase [Candidatus Woesearchaeota archaeon]|nr:DEAD/DEAH box helicase [Candidatus Woesearchaeota archaeon]
MLKDFTPRLYQQTILNTAANNNTMVVLPTGMGKTAIALLLTAQRLTQYPNSKIILLAPTKPLCEQHQTTFRKHVNIEEEKIVLFTGSVTPEKREQLWKNAQIIISTPQGLENDTINNRINLKEVSLLIIDEAHHATGDYSYVWVAQQYDKHSPFSRILALTASPGSDLEKIKEICSNLKIEKIEIRTEDDPDVSPYIQPVKTNWVKVEFPPELKQIQTYLKTAIRTKLHTVQTLGYSQSSELTKGELLGLQTELQKKISSGEKDFEALKSISLTAEALKIEHALELLETQGLRPLYKYVHKLQSESLTSKIKAVKNLVQDENFKSAVHYIDELSSKELLHPKLSKLKELIAKEISSNRDARIIIFTQFRDSAEIITKELDFLNLKNHIFVGQAKKEGLGFSQKQQKEILDNFRNNQFNILVATSVAEEGLDIPKVDKVIFYEPIPSAIRSIQRRGRTGRLEKGEVTVLITSNTRDEAYRWSSFHKEKKMHRNLQELKQKFYLLSEQKQEPATLTNYMKQNSEPITTIIADHREKDNRVVKELIELNIPVKTAQLESADYVLSGHVGVELKHISDFVNSIIDGRLLDQMRQLKKNFPKSILILEGDEDIYSVRRIHPNAIRGMLASIALDFNIPIVHTKTPKETAAMLAIMAKREQEKDHTFSLHERKPHTIKDQQEFFVSSLPNIGIKTARTLLEHFTTIKSLINAQKEDLTKIDGIGDKTTDKLLELFESKYLKKE